MNKLVERFLSYVAIETQSDNESSQCPSTAGQLVLGQQLKDELVAMGLADVSLDENGYLMARLPGNTNGVPTIGFISHMDTALDETAHNVKAQIVENYPGGDITLGQSGEKLSPTQYPFLNGLIGHDLITTDGTTLLGADDKAGIAEIFTALAYLIEHPEIPHGDICVGITPDEEIGRGADKFDVKKFGAQWAYTIDGGKVGELEYENFNASSATVICHGVSVHPGTAKDTLVNAMNIAAQFQLMMPQDETPEATEGREGFYHLTTIKPGIARTQLHYILRDFEKDGMARRKAFIKSQVEALNARLSKGHVEVEITDSYANMAEQIAPHPHIIEIAKQAMHEAGVEPIITPIRGGTDGARLSYMGLPCPNIFTGGYNFHGIHECISINSMQKAVDVIVKIVQLTAQSAK
ncbi:peptidase T [Celerinatantimonas sp. MCCC 1A17872]|uniref:peptidase T n=1 Tax=Celerinatantimonas sp. MCCC 1A17872 TaxID=3177514 RepID=UPI0038CA1860